MTNGRAIADHWATGDVYDRIAAALTRAGKRLDSVTIEDLAPVDHVHAGGLPATAKLADRLGIEPGQRVLDIGCGLGGPARYIAARFGCAVSGIDITGPFVDAANKLTALVRMIGQVRIQQGDALQLPYPDGEFDAAYTQHVTMNVADRPRFFAEAYRVLKPGGRFGFTEHGLGVRGHPHHPVPWSVDGSGAYLVTPAETRAILERTGFRDIVVEDTGPEYVAAYRGVIQKADSGTLPLLGLHVVLGESLLEKTRNSARNIEEGRTHPIQVLCRKPR